MAILREHGVNDATLLAAAWLHDVVEDSDATIEDIENLFGSKVAEIVNDLTTILPDIGRAKAGYLDKKEIKRLILLGRSFEMQHASKVVKLADRLDNIQSAIGHWRSESVKGYGNVGIEMWMVYQATTAPESEYRSLIDSIGKDIQVLMGKLHIGVINA